MGGGAAAGLGGALRAFAVAVGWVELGVVASWQLGWGGWVVGVVGC